MGRMNLPNDLRNRLQRALPFVADVAFGMASKNFLNADGVYADPHWDDKTAIRWKATFDESDESAVFAIAIEPLEESEAEKMHMLRRASSKAHEN